MRLLLILLLPAFAVAQDDPITEACSKDPNGPGYFYGELLIKSPDDIAGSYVTGGMSNSGEFLWGDTTGLLWPGETSDLVIARDPGAPPDSDPDEACTPLTNPDEVAGHIALIRRGGCAFSDKALRAQEAQAVGFIVYNDGREDFGDWQIINMLAVASGPEVTIPGLFVPRELGNQIVSQIDDFENSVVATLRYHKCYTFFDDIEENVIPGTRELSPAYPNPFTTRSQFVLALDRAQHVEVRAYNILGQYVATLSDGVLPASTDHILTFKADGFPPGVYIVRVMGETFAQTRRATLIR